MLGPVCKASEDGFLNQGDSAGPIQVQLSFPRVHRDKICEELDQYSVVNNSLTSYENTQARLLPMITRRIARPKATDPYYSRHQTVKSR